MGVVSAMVGLGRQKNERGGRKASADESMIRESTLEDGLRHVLATIDNLKELDSRLSVLEGDLLGDASGDHEELPEPGELGLDGFVPRLMESSLLIGALTRRMHLRMGVLEGALGPRA
ncbi:MAG: hypothetical protein MI723_05930, partial [Caulobacterales bacterium]|nr:hypothetical protein [Caulobacterales bacterium]